MLREKGEVVGFENIELISDRPFDTWLGELKQLKKQYPNKIVIASIMLLAYSFFVMEPQAQKRRAAQQATAEATSGPVTVTIATSASESMSAGGGVQAMSPVVAPRPFAAASPART